MSEQHPEQHNESRRRFLKQAGTVAWATPLILTMATRPALAQVSCAPNGSPCGTYVEELDVCAPTNGVTCCGDCAYLGSGFGCFCVDI